MASVVGDFGKWGKQAHDPPILELDLFEPQVGLLFAQEADGGLKSSAADPSPPPLQRQSHFSASSFEALAPPRSWSHLKLRRGAGQSAGRSASVPSAGLGERGAGTFDRRLNPTPGGAEKREPAESGECGKRARAVSEGPRRGRAKQAPILGPEGLESPGEGLGWNKWGGPPPDRLGGPSAPMVHSIRDRRGAGLRRPPESREGSPHGTRGMTVPASSPCGTLLPSREAG